MATKRMLQLGEQIRDHIAIMLVRGEVHDPRIQNVTIHSVKMTSDLQTAKVYFVTSAANRAVVEKGLKNATGFIRKELGKQLQIRFVPHIQFYYDDSMEHALKMSTILAKVSEELKADDEEKLENQEG